MLIDFVVNWRMKMFVSLLFLVALKSCYMEQRNLYEAWWLHQRHLQGTSRQIVKRAVQLPDWYQWLHSILSGLRNLQMNKDIILSILSVGFLAVGTICLSLGSFLTHQQMKDGSNTPPFWYWFASLKVKSKTIGIGVVISSSVLSNTVAEPIYISVFKISSNIPQHLHTSIEDRSTIEISGTDRAGREEQSEIRRNHLQQMRPNVEIKNNVRIGERKRPIGYRATQKQMKKFYRSLSEKDRRRYAGIEALKLGRGGIVYIANLLDCDRKTVSKGIAELKKLSRRHVDQHRIRKRGGGRKPYAQNKKLANIDNNFLEVLRNNTAGDPMREDVIWTNLTPGDICQLLSQEHNIQVSPTVARQLLEKHNYRLRQLLKKETMKQVPNRNLQFIIIGRWRDHYQNSPNPIVSIDTKKKEYLGNFYRKGRLYTMQAQHCYDHDYPSFAKGIIIPRGLYDLKQNKGFLHLGTSHDTSEFVCDCLKDWWLRFGRYDYPDAYSILVLCDGGGSNSCRHYIFKQDLRNLGDEIGIEIRIAHYPSYCSKWNPIEHRLFPHVTRACQGVVFESVELVKSLMEKTKTRTGLTTNVTIVDKFYETKRKASDDFKQNMGILFDDNLPKLNYRVVPNGEVI